MRWLSVLGLALFTSTLYAQICQVAMVDRYNRTIEIFSDYSNGNGQDHCFHALKECRKTLRMRPELGGIDCIKLGQSRPETRPVPNPMPYPQPESRPVPRPAPRPEPIPERYPTPVPRPTYHQVDAANMLIDIDSGLASSEGASKVLEQIISQLNTRALLPLVRICSSTRTWLENRSCLVDGIGRAPLELVLEEEAIQAVGLGCKVTTTWLDERECFERSLRHVPSVGYLAYSCQNMSSSESASRCFRQVFGVETY